MNAAINRQVRLAARPVGMPKESDFALAEEPVPEPGPGQALVRVLYLSLDPYMRGRMSAAKSYAPPVAIGGVMTGGAVGEVVRSQAKGPRARRPGGGHVRLAGIRALPTGRGARAARVPPPALLRARHPRHAGRHRLLRPAGGGPPAPRRHGGGLGGLGRGRRRGRPDREDRRLPRRRHRGFGREGRLRHQRARLRRRDQLPHGERHRRRARRGLPRRHRRLLRQRRRTDDRRGDGAARLQGPRGGLRLHPPLQPDRALRRPQPPAPHPRQPGMRGRGSSSSTGSTATRRPSPGSPRGSTRAA